MANPLLSYGWTPDSVVAASGGFGGGTNTGALPNNGATLAFGQNVTRSYPAWMNAYGYQGSLADNSAKTFTDPGVDPYSLLPSHAASPDTAPQTASAGGINDGFQSGNTEGGAGTFDSGTQSPGVFDNPNPATSILDFIGQIPGGARDFVGAVGGMFGGGPPNASANDAAAVAGPGGGSPNQFARGGLVTRNRLMGPDPRGPDDGYASLNIGEGVLTAAALKHYGKDIVSRLNRLSVPKSALK